MRRRRWLSGQGGCPRALRAPGKGRPPRRLSGRKRITLIPKRRSSWLPQVKMFAGTTRRPTKLARVLIAVRYWSSLDIG